MLRMFYNLQDLVFSNLMQVYSETNRKNGKEYYPDVDENLAALNAEQDFYAYLRHCFFKTPGAVYAVWEENQQFISALRLEPYEDGVLLEALETMPEQRGKGYAKQLVSEVLAETNCKVYSHVNKNNMVSLAVHLACGFEKISDTAVYIDGTDAPGCVTLCYGK